MKTHVDLELAGKTYRLVPGAKALVRVAQDLADPVRLYVALGLMETTGQPPNTWHVLKTLHIALVESGYDIEEDAAFEALHGKGIAELYEPYAAFVGGLVNAGQVPDTPEAEDQHPKKARRPSRRSTGRE